METKEKNASGDLDFMYRVSRKYKKFVYWKSLP